VQRRLPRVGRVLRAPWPISPPHSKKFAELACAQLDQYFSVTGRRGRCKLGKFFWKNPARALPSEVSCLKGASPPCQFSVCGLDRFASMGAISVSSISFLSLPAIARRA
jgi:hypothetical protein